MRIFFEFYFGDQENWGPHVGSCCGFGLQIANGASLLVLGNNLLDFRGNFAVSGGILRGIWCIEAATPCLIPWIST